MTTVVMIAYGSRGDVDPFTGLGKQLKEAGYRVILAANEPYADLVRSAGLEYRALPNDLQVDFDAKPGRKFMANGSSLLAQAQLVPYMVECMRVVGAAVMEIAKEADVLLLSLLGATLGYHIAEGMGIPSIGAYLVPMEPTGDYPPMAMGSRGLGRFANRNISRLSVTLPDFTFQKIVNEVRRELGLPRTNVVSVSNEKRRRDWPIVHGISEHILPRPRDWRSGLRLAGFWWAHTPENWEASPELVDFLESGSAPVYFGFGSTGLGQGERLTEIITSALRKIGHRGVIQSGWAQLQADDDDMLTIGDASYPWLFPKMAALVHHAGPGTMASGIREEVPAVPVPGPGIQPFFARRMVNLGLSPDMRRQKDLDADWLANVLSAAITNGSYRQRTSDMAARLTAEDSAAPVIRAIESVTAKSKSR